MIHIPFRIDFVRKQGGRLYNIPIAVIQYIRVGNPPRSEISAFVMDLLNVMKNLSIKPADESSSTQVMKTFAADINNVPTEIVFGNYSDRYLVIISQYEKVGSMLMVEKDQVHSPLGTNDIYTTKVIFGDTGEEQQVAARFVAEGIKISKPMCIFINLKSYDIDTVRACKDILLKLKQKNSDKEE